MTDEIADSLEARLRSPAPEEERIEDLVRALDHPDPVLRTLGVQGLARTLAAVARPAEAARAAEALADRDVPWSDRLALARTLSRLPGKSPALVAALRRIAESPDDDELRAACREACDRYAGAHGGTAIDWPAWLRRVEREHDVRGLLPAVWLHFDEAPEEAAAVLRAAYLGACGGSLYSEGFSQDTILSFLQVRGRVDETVARDCARRLLSDAPSALLLAVLRSVPPWSGLAETLWCVLETRPVQNPVLLREALVDACGSDRAAAAALIQRLRARGQPSGAVPYLRFLADNPGWGETPDLLREASRLGACRAGEARAEWERAWGNLGKRPPDPDDGAVDPGPGFADE